MRVIGTVKDVILGADGNAHISLEIPNTRHSAMVKELDKSKLYAIEIKESKPSRSIQQNRYFWLLLGEIDKAINGERSNDEESIYAHLIELTGAKYEYIGALPETEESLKKVYRAVKFIKKIDLNGKEGNMYKCYLGSSKMNTKEMAMLIESAIDLAEEVGIDTLYWRGLLQ